ncbi:multiple sugar transport system substrate-binding protein [Rhizobiales bacterium GAS188]|jgi:multiple sugar transport system substrate-binding protein|nr:multiple sugar transport system substrate-binding protein [Rhizobiales bacterium GAS188]
MNKVRKDLTTGRGTLSRRALLGAGAGMVLAGDLRARAQTTTPLTMTVWGAQAEQDAFNAAIAEYQTQHPEIAIRLEVNGNAMQLYQQVDTRLAGRQAPDIFRVQYQQIGRYASTRAVIDLGPYVDASYSADFEPAFLQAVTYKGRPYAMPHHTDTFALYYNRDLLQKIGVEVPTSLETSWSWQDFIRVARALKEKAGAPYGFAMGWQNAAYRWLPFLYQHGGELLNEDLTASQLATPKGIETIAWTQSWFKEGLVPPSTSIKSSEQPQNLFANGTIGMLLHGDWQIPFLTKNMKADWGVTYMPRDVAMASDLGGNCLAISRDCKHPELAADFLKFLSGKEKMRDFVTSAQFLPVRKSLMTERLPYALRPDAMEVFVKQSSTIPSHLVRTVTMPVFSKINVALTDQFDLAFTSDQDATATAKAIDTRVQALLST